MMDIGMLATCVIFLGKKYGNWFRRKCAKGMVKELAETKGMPESQLIQIEGKEIWLHPQVAVDLAQWLSPKFAVSVSDYIYGYMTGDLDLINQIMNKL